MKRVAVVDNHEVVREGVAARLNAQADIEVVTMVSSVLELREGGATSGSGAAAVRGTDVVLLDLWLDDGDSISDIAGLLTSGWTVLLYTSEQRPVPLRQAVSAGATGLLLKSDPLDSVVEGVRAAAAGEFYCSGTLAHALLSDPTAAASLSARQVEILEALSDGLDYRAVARVLDMSVAAVKTHLARTREKFRALGIEAGNSHHLVQLAKDQGFLG